MQTSGKYTNKHWPTTLSQLLQNRQNHGLQYVMRHSQRLIMINELLYQHLPAELHQHCYVMQATPTMLTIAADSAAWLTRLRYLQPQLLSALKLQPQCTHLSQIKLRTNPMPIAPLTLSPTQSSPQQLSQTNRQLFSQIAKTVTNPKLSQSLKKLAEE